ncbi:MAG TPA: peptide deformylase [Candidatus Saccharimonadales bacterium]
MTKDNIISLPNKNLRQKSKTVTKITPTILKVIDDMTKATISWDTSREHEVGVALAAVQINELTRVIIVRQDYENKKDLTFIPFINPEITKLDGDIIEDFEGCLSVPDIYGKVPRYDKVKVKAINIDGKEFEITAKGFMARIFQHEIDHTEGMVFIDRIKDRQESFYRLNKDGKLERLDYEEVKKNTVLW